MPFPRMIRLKQHFRCVRVEDISAEVEAQLRRLGLAAKVRAGESVAITAGSRGIANYALILRGVIDHVRRLGAEPFLVPAMGSHGGGTVEGQLGILAGYGVTAEALGAEIRASMETVVIDHTPLGLPVHFDRHALAADHVIVVGRIKPHTAFVGEIESGLHKMMLIGLGKHEGAKIYHRAIMDYSWPEILTSVSHSVLNKGKILCGLAIVENALDETALIEALAPDEFAQREAALLVTAREWLPRLPFGMVDLLIIDEIGKNVSGTGMDTNVIGRKFHDHKSTDRDNARVKTIFVRGLTQATHGNACGLGIAEFTNQRTIEAVDQRITAINSITGGHTSAGALPIAFATDREVVAAALTTVGLVPPEYARVTHIANTLHLAEVLVSESYLPAIAERPDLEILDDPREMDFDPDNNLFPVRMTTDFFD